MKIPTVTIRQTIGGEEVETIINKVDFDPDKHTLVEADAPVAFKSQTATEPDKATEPEKATEPAQTTPETENAEPENTPSTDTAPAETAPAETENAPIPDDLKNMSWNDLRAAAAKVSDEPINSKADAYKALMAAREAGK